MAEGATHVENSNSCRKIAFTLSEVLITLGIIGIVAAITIHSLMANYRKHVTEQQLKKVYTTIYNAVKMSEAENGISFHDMTLEGWENHGGYSSVNYMFDNYLSPYLPIIKDYGNVRILSKPGKNYDGSVLSLSGDPRLMRTVVLKDGVRITYNIEYLKSAHSSVPDHLGAIQILLKDDYKNGQAYAGKNYFSFSLEHSRLRNGFVMTNHYIISKICEETICNGQSACARVFICNGFKFPDNYPVKF